MYLNNINKDNLSNEALIDHPDIIKLVDSEIEKSMTKFASYETVKKFKLHKLNNQLLFQPATKNSLIYCMFVLKFGL